jgi:hypothetical protein
MNGLGGINPARNQDSNPAHGKLAQGILEAECD